LPKEKACLQKGQNRNPHLAAFLSVGLHHFGRNTRNPDKVGAASPFVRVADNSGASCPEVVHFIVMRQLVGRERSHLARRGALDSLNRKVWIRALTSARQIGITNFLPGCHARLRHHRSRGFERASPRPRQRRTSHVIVRILGLPDRDLHSPDRCRTGPRPSGATRGSGRPGTRYGRSTWC